ncbi:Putative CDP-glycerol:glycerophosphate glycerophosphotransferase [Oceanobacillus picturae]|uniref:CDP-glycerol:glycerophosphate glycerophosphotransferase n=1 Tax=Oceanobacillus picturae TaxID=171693 RepID=W9AQ10_9BACI|nr:CDP-glycerol glycerophosphotransferase family protein [Oceanobacillus picturae]CDO04977.1 Putative CDP-glycerol:glycerophosphate glycerophosphotransferase [Oceanobacillus picturae]
MNFIDINRKGYQTESVLFGQIKVEGVFLKQDQLVIEFLTSLEEGTELYLYNERNKLYNKVSCLIEGNQLYLNIDQFKEWFEGFQGHWSFCIKSKFQSYTLLESIKIQNSEGLNIHIKDLFINEDLYCGIYINSEGFLYFCRLDELRYKINTRNQITETVDISKASLNENTFEFLLDDDFRDYEAVSVVLVARKGKKERLILDTQMTNRKISCMLPYEEIQNGRYNIFLEAVNSQDYFKARLQVKEDKQDIGYYNMNVDESLLIYKTVNGLLSIVKGKSFNVFREKTKTEILISKIKKNRKDSYQLGVNVASQEKLEVSKILIKLRDEENFRAMEAINFSFEKTGKKNYKVKGDIVLDWEKFRPLYWDILIEVTDYEGYKGYMRVNKATYFVKKIVKSDYFKLSLISHDRMVYPYLTLNNSISFMMRQKEQYENVKNKIKELAAYLTYKILRGYPYKNKEVWLGFEKFSRTAQDNGYAFFNYVEQNELHDNFYYIIDRNSPDYGKIKDQNRNIVKFMSFKYFYLIYVSKLLVSSETKKHAYNLRVRTGLIANSLESKQSVFLQHGVTGLKKSDVFKKSKGRGNFNLVVATSDIEQKIIKENWKYNDEEVITTGFSRWDLLEDKADSVARKKIFVMPTWRSWMEGMTKEEFAASDYYHHYFSFLSSNKLGQLLEENNLDLVFFLHPKFQEYISEFSISQKNIYTKSFLDIKVNEEMMESSILISDYSSITWDMFYMNKPVLFYQFDHEKYNAQEGSYLDMDRELFGERAENASELVNILSEYINNDFTIKPRYQKKRKKYFKYTDHDNSKRIFNEINRRINLGD